MTRAGHNKMFKKEQVNEASLDILRWLIALSTVLSKLGTLPSFDKNCIHPSLI